MVIRVLVADDHAWTRQALEHSLEMQHDLHVVGAAADGDSAVELALLTRPDVVLMDASMPGTDGIAATQKLLHELPFVRVVVLSVGYSGPLARRALAAGACGFLVKHGVPQALPDAIRVAARGGRPLAPELAHLLDS